jgi:hypothetical protein
MHNHNRIYDAFAGLSYTGLVEIATLIAIFSSRAQASAAQGIGAPIFKGHCVSGLPH